MTTYLTTKQTSKSSESISHIPFQNAINLEANYKNLTKKGTYAWKFKNTSKLLMSQNRNHNKKFKNI